MGLIVQKFGGSSVRDRERLLRAMRIVRRTWEQGGDVVVVLSAQGDTTDALLARARELTEEPPPRELDALLATGETASVALGAIALASLGVPAVSLSGWQVPVGTDGTHGGANVRSVGAERIRQELAQRRVVLAAGFQGVDAAGEFAYGNSQMKDSGCGVIGTYNALYLLGKDPSLAEVGRRYEISGAMAGGGAWGTNPYGAPQVLKQYGVQYEEYTDPDALEREAGEGDVMIVSIWNRKGTIFEGYHTFAVQKVNGELMVYNRFNNSAESTEKKTMGEVIENGQFIVGYRVQNAK